MADPPAWRTTRSSSGRCCSRWSSPSAGHEVEYNRWYEHDHFYCGVHGRRVAVRRRPLRRHQRLKDLRYPVEHRHDRPTRSPGSYLAIYWVLEGTARRVEPLGRRPGELAARERPHVREAHPHPHAAVREAVVAAARPTNGCTIELALDHDYPGLVVVCRRREGRPHARRGRRVVPRHVPARRDDASRGAPTSCSTRHDAAAARRPPGRRAAPAAGPNRFLQLHFLDHDPEEGWADGYARIGDAIDDERPRHARVDGPVHPDRLRHRQVHRRALVIPASRSGS